MNDTASASLTIADRAQALLEEFLGPEATFRDGQLAAIDALVAGRRRVLVVERTGWGKSIVYLIATRLLREDGAGPTLVVSPLLALMRNQTEMGARIGVRSATINSENVEDWHEIERAARAGDVDLLLISPERLNSPRFREQVLAAVAGSVGLFVVDEVHCISDWGHDFRPDYRRVREVLTLFDGSVPVLGCTATANDRVVADLQHQLGDDLVVVRGPLARASLRLRVLDLPSQAERLAWLAREVPHLPGTGIVYCLTIEDTNRVTRWLRSEGIEAVAYSGQTLPEDRVIVETALSENRVKAVVATSALGMGYDKPDLGFVVHFQSPGSPIAYYQQIGRAGRALDRAEVVLLRGHEDRDIQDWFIDSAFPDRADAEAVLQFLSEGDEPVGVARIEAVVNVRRSRLEAMLKILEVDGAVGRERGRWYRTAAPWRYDEERVERVTGHRRREQAAMVTYGTTERCLEQFLLAELDDPAAPPCGRCGNCAPEAEAPLDPAVIGRAVDFLRHQPIEIEPRRQWPTGLDEVKGRIGAAEQLQPGRALCLWGDAGWGTLVRQAWLEDREVADDLVTAAAALVGGWSPQPPPTWVTCVPSGPHADRVLSFAERLASRLGLPFDPVLEGGRRARPQTELVNSAQQVRNLHGTFTLARPPRPEPALLIDGLVDSRWTLTVVGARLVQAGVSAVHPLVLAKGAGR